jgi:hypothetical protein
LAMYFAMLTTGSQFAALDRHEPVASSHANAKYYQSLCVQAMILAGKLTLYCLSGMHN